MEDRLFALLQRQEQAELAAYQSDAAIARMIRGDFANADRCWRR